MLFNPEAKNNLARSLRSLENSAKDICLHIRFAKIAAEESENQAQVALLRVSQAKEQIENWEGKFQQAVSLIEDMQITLSRME